MARVSSGQPGDAGMGAGAGGGGRGATCTDSAQPTHAYAIGAITHPQKRRRKGTASAMTMISAKYRTMAKHQRQSMGAVRRHVSLVTTVR